MRPILWASGAWVVLASGVGAVLWAARTPTGRPPTAVAPVSLRAHAAVDVPPYAAESLGAFAVAHDLFRNERRPAPVAYDPLRVIAGAAGSPPPAPKPALVLEGIVWGAVPEAVVEGIPGVDGPRVLRVGEILGGLRVQRIEARRVVIAGMDTTWTLTVRQSWR
jgi:hypothetical protein